FLSLYERRHKTHGIKPYIKYLYGLEPSTVYKGHAIEPDSVDKIKDLLEAIFIKLVQKLDDLEGDSEVKSIVSEIEDCLHYCAVSQLVALKRLYTTLCPAASVSATEGSTPALFEAE